MCGGFLNYHTDFLQHFNLFCFIYISLDHLKGSLGPRRHAWISTSPREPEFFIVHATVARFSWCFGKAFLVDDIRKEFGYHRSPAIFGWVRITVAPPSRCRLHAHFDGETRQGRRYEGIGDEWTGGAGPRVGGMGGDGVGRHDEKIHLGRDVTQVFPRDSAFFSITSRI